MVVVGAFPQFIKCTSISWVIRRKHHEIFVHTGQHYDTRVSDIYLKKFEIPEPDNYLGVGSDVHGYQTGEKLQEY